MEELKYIRKQLEKGEVENSIQALNRYLSREDALFKDEAYYLLGNAYRKCGNWQQALNNYQ